MNEPKWKEKILCHSLKLKSLNGAPVSFQEKHIAVQAVGSPQQKKQFYLLKWDWTINQIVERLQFQDWDPTRITKLSLANAELHEIHVGGLVMLKELDVSSNSLTTIVGAGLERLDFLHDFNFSHNMISDLDCLSVLGYLPEIKTVRAHDNPLSQNEYRKRIIFYTCNMKGTNRCPGLVTLDGIPITIDQRIEAQQFYQDFTADQTNILRWNYAIINLYGHHQIRKVPDFIKRVRKMTMSNCNLSYVDLRSFTSLQFVDLSKNNITKVDGLLSLRRLRYLDLSSNPNLPKEDVISQLSRLKKLRHVLLAPDLTKAKKDVGRAQVLLKLVKNNQYLFALDDILISPSERQDLAKSLINSRYELDRYYFHLAIVNQIVPFLERSYNDEGILPGKIYEPEEVTMLRFANLQLPQGSFAFNRFTSITRLDLSGNKIVSIVDIGLQSCRAIEILDFSRNDVDNKVHQIADLLNCFPELEVLAMAENPVCQKKSGYRMSILKKLNTMKGLVVKLKILDQEVTPADRKEVWAYHKLDDKHKEELRFKETMEQSGYLKQNPLTIEKIHLNQCALQMVDLTAFSNVRYLLLRGNRLVSLVGTGVLEMKKLKCVDLRNNMLKNIEEIYQLIENNPDLETIGLKLKQIGANTEIKIKEENFAKLKGDEHRDLVIKHAPRLRQVYSPLWEIDDQEITIDEIAKNWPYATSIEDTEKEVTKFRFEAILFRKYVSSFKLSTALSTITVNRLQIQALDLSGQKLTAVDFTGFANLKKLRLKNNLLDDKALMASGLINTSVAELDLRENRIVQLDTVVQFIDQCQNHLKMLFIENNPCYTSKHPPKSKGYKQQRQKLLHLLNSTQVPTWSMILNGDKVTVVERCRAMEQSMKPAEVEVLRTAITLAEKGYAGAEKVVDVSHRYLTNIQILSTYTQLIRLELAKNRLTDIDLNFFKNLPKLHYLDIRNNEIPREKLLLSVGASASLRELYIHKAGPEFNEAPVIYANSVFKMMRMLEVVDGINNPIQLSYDQKLALRYLAKFDVSPNNVQEIEITKEVTKAQFWCIVLAFQTLQGTVDKEAVGVRSIKIANSSQLDDYRFMLINHIDTLTVIDGQPVPEAEFNALIVTLDHMRKRLESKKEQPVQLPTQISLRMLRRSIMQHQKLLIDQGERAPARVPTPSGVKPPLHQHTSSIAIELRETDLGEGRNSIYSTNPVNEESVQLDHGSNLFDINSHKQATNINEEDIDFTYIERNFNSIRKLTLLVD
jgi:Leucine-rich repeat (LRR) protein